MTTNIFKPILFNTEMVQANLAGRKKQTRRVITNEMTLAVLDYALQNGKPIDEFIQRNAKYQIGDILWVRETWLKLDSDHQINSPFVYRANRDVVSEEQRWEYIKTGRNYHWKPSLFMPKEAARIFLKVTNVRCERLQDISEEDAIAEGIDTFENSLFNETRYRDYTDGKRRDKEFSKYPDMAKQIGYSHFGGNPWPDWRDPISCFQSLWDSINAKKQPWESNPWVWVYDFERIEKPENFLS